jgi:hypothetical protein
MGTIAGHSPPVFDPAGDRPTPYPAEPSGSACRIPINCLAANRRLLRNVEKGELLRCEGVELAEVSPFPCRGGETRSFSAKE